MNHANDGLLATLLLSTVAFPVVASADVCSTVEVLEFDGNKANESVTTQVDFGPRIPGSNASIELRNWFMERDPNLIGDLTLIIVEDTILPILKENSSPRIRQKKHQSSFSRPL